MSERDDDAKLRAAFLRLRAEEARRAPTLAQLRARADGAAREGAPWGAWPRIAAPLAGAAAAALALWIAIGPRPDDAPRVAADAPQQLARTTDAPLAPPLIALGSLRSPTDVLLTPPLPALAPSFSSSLIPAPATRAAAPRSPDQSRTSSSRRFPA